MPILTVERRCPICGTDIETGHFKHVHPEYAKARGMLWKLLGIYFVILLAIPYTVAPLLTGVDSVLASVVLVYAFTGLVLMVGSRLWVERRYRRLWKQDHPISTSGLRVEITIEKNGKTGTPASLTGVVTAKLKGIDGKTYLAVRLDNPVRLDSQNGQEKTTASELAVTIRVWGLAPIDELIQSKRLASPVQILKPLIRLNPDNSVLDLSNAVYFSSGMIKRL